MADDQPIRTIDANLAKAFVAFQAELTPIPKSAENPFFKSKYADAGAVQNHVGPLLTKHGLAVMQPIRDTTEGKTQIITRLVHSSGAYIEEVSNVVIGKQDAQGKGSAITYERRYAYMAITGAVAEDEDDDGNAASNRQQGGRPAVGSSSEPKPVAPPARSAVEQYADELAKLKGLWEQLFVVDEEEQAEFYQDAIGKVKPTTLNEIKRAVAFAETAVLDRGEPAS